MITALGATVVPQNDERITHYIITDTTRSIRLTPAIVTIFSRTDNIVTLEWLRESSKSKQLLPCGKFIAKDTRITGHPEFLMTTMIANWKEARKRGGVLAGYSVYISMVLEFQEQFKLTIVAAGAILITLDKVGTSDKSNLLIVSDLVGKLIETTLHRAIEDGATQIPYTVLYEILLYQSFDSVTSLKSKVGDAKSKPLPSSCKTPTGKMSVKNEAKTEGKGYSGTSHCKENNVFGNRSTTKNGVKEATKTQEGDRRLHITTTTDRKKKEPKPTSSKKSGDVTGSPFKDKSNEHNSTMLPSKKRTNDNSSRDAEIAMLNAALKLKDAELKVKDDEITKLEVAAQQRSVREKVSDGMGHTRPSVSKWGRKGDANIAAIPSFPTFVPPPKFQVDGHGDWKIVNSITVSESPWRTLSNENDGDLSRALLGGNGYLIIQENLTNVVESRTGAIGGPGTVRRVLYYDINCVMKFRAECPKKTNPFGEIQGNAGMDFKFAWDVTNEMHSSGGTTIVGAMSLGNVPGHRRYVFAFTSPAVLAVALYSMFYDNQGYLEEFFTVNRRFYPKEANVPAHKVVMAEAAMEIDRPKTRRPAYTPEQEMKRFGIDHDVYAESQC